MRELERKEAGEVVGGDDGDSCGAVASAVTVVVGSTVSALGTPLSATGAALLSLGGIQVYQAAESICISLSTPTAPVSSAGAAMLPLPNWAMYMLPWPNKEDL